MNPKQQITLRNCRQGHQKKKKKKSLRKLKNSHQKSTQTAGEMAMLRATVVRATGEARKDPLLLEPIQRLLLCQQGSMETLIK